MFTLLPNKIVAMLITIGGIATAFPIPPPFPPDLGGDTEDAPGGAEPTPDIPTPTPSTPSSGKEFYQKECAICHGARGEGTERGTPLNKPYKVYNTHITRHGRKGHPQFAIPMPAYPREMLSDRLMVQIWDYVESFSTPGTGEELYRAYCANCHGNDARGGMSSQPLVNETGVVTKPEVFALWVRWGQDDGFYESRGSYMPRWNPSEISDVDVVKIRSYLESLSPMSWRPHAL
jgi:mono/diheme cytochrome c family protein